MAAKTPVRLTGPPGALPRPDWKPGAPFTAADLTLDQAYAHQRIRRHLRLIHGWGVVCGLNVVAGGSDWLLIICPGYGIGPCGDEIFLTAPYRFDLRDYLWTRPFGRESSNTAWISIEAADYEESGELLNSCACGCGECRCREDKHRSGVYYARGFRVVVAWTPPRFPTTRFDMCTGGVPPCPPCPDTCALLLAKVTLPDDSGN